MRRSKLDTVKSGGPLCSNCMRAAHLSGRTTPPSPPPISERVSAQIARGNDKTPVDTDPEFEQSLEAAKRVAAVFGNKIDQEDVEKLKNRLRQSGGDNPLGASLAYQFKSTMRSCLWTVLLMLAFFAVFGWLAS